MPNGPVWARGRCRISPPRFLAECCKRQLNQLSFVVLYFRLSTFFYLYWVYLSIFSCTVLFVSISQVIGCEDRLRNDLYCVEWGVKLYSNHPYAQCYFSNVWTLSVICQMANCINHRLSTASCITGDGYTHQQQPLMNVTSIIDTRHQ